MLREAVHVDAWIEQRRDSYTYCVTLMCELPGVSRSGVHGARTAGIGAFTARVEPSPRE